jgi:hypothetical protein
MEQSNMFAVMVEGKQTPSKLYGSSLEAESEAMRLARQERKDVYILKIVGKAEMTDVKITYYR